MVLPAQIQPFTSQAGKLLVGTVSGAPAPLLAGAHRVSWLPLSGTEVVSVSDMPAAIAAYRALPGVAWVERNRTVHVATAPDDPAYSAQWTLHPAAEQPWGLDWQPVYPAVQGAGALVAVVDTGYMLGGSDQAAHVRVDLQRNFVSGTNDATDDNGHGTFTSNEIAESTNNAVGAAGIAPEATIVPVKVLDASGAGDLAGVAAGIDYAASIGARVINLSLAGDESNALCAAVAAASRTAVVVAASGNDATSTATATVGFPAACPGALAVGSVAADGTRPGYANTGCPLAVVAPGGDELNWTGPPAPPPDSVIQQTFDPTTHSFAYFAEIGTSMASAQVSGEAALLVGLGADAAQARRLITGNIHDPGAKGYDSTFGAGAVDIGAAVAAFQSGTVTPAPIRGYRTVTSTGSVKAIDGPCASGFEGTVPRPPGRPVVGIAATPSGKGYWLVGSDGTVDNFGDAAALGSPSGAPLNQPIVGIAATPSGHGYWLVASDGGIFNYGDAAFFGSTGAIRLNRPIVGMTSTPTGRGYFMVASDGGIFAFGDALFRGSTGNIVLNQPIVGMAATADGRGYWMVASDGGIFNFGDAPFFGSTGAIRLVSPIVGIVPTSDARGYAMAAADGGVFTFGDAPFYGAAPGSGAPVVGVAPEPWPGL